MSNFQRFAESHTWELLAIAVIVVFSAGFWLYGKVLERRTRDHSKGR